MKRCVILGLLLSVSILMLSACSGQKSGQTMMTSEDVAALESGTLPYSVEIKEEEVTYNSVIDGRLLAKGIYHYPVVQAKVENARYMEKADTLSPTQQAAKRVNIHFEQWLKDQKSNFNEISAMAESSYSESLDDPEVGWRNPDYCFLDEVDISSWSNQHLVCITFWRESFTGGAHGIASRQPVTFDVRNGREITINDMTDDYTGLCSTVETEICRQIREQAEESDKSIFFKDYEEVIPQWINRSIFFWDENLEVVFGAYDIAPYAAGEQAFRIPYQLIATYLNDYGREVLELS